MSDFDGKVAVVLGGSSGLGLAVAERLADAGAAIVLAARGREKLEAAAAKLGATPVVCDITRNDEVAALAKEALAAHGRVDVAVNSAGFEQSAPLRDLEPEPLETMVAVQFTGALFFIRHLAAAMQEGGCIVTLSSLTATLVAEGYAAYAGAKAGINHVTRIAASEYAGDGIRVNAVSPSLIETPMTENLFALPGVEAAMLEETPLARMGAPRDVAETVCWLASDRASYITGQNILVDGGMSLRRLPRGPDFIRHARKAGRNPS